MCDCGLGQLVGYVDWVRASTGKTDGGLHIGVALERAEISTSCLRRQKKRLHLLVGLDGLMRRSTLCSGAQLELCGKITIEISL